MDFIKDKSNSFLKEETKNKDINNNNNTLKKGDEEKENKDKDNKDNSVKNEQEYNNLINLIIEEYNNKILLIKEDNNKQLNGLEERLNKIENCNTILIKQLEEKNKQLQAQLEEEKNNCQILAFGAKLYKEESEKKDIELKIKETKIVELNETIEKLNVKMKELENIIHNNYTQDKILSLMDKLEKKEKEIKEIKSKLPFELSENEKLMTVIFLSTDQKIHFSVICKNTQNFNILENILYEKYPEYKESENFFLLGGIKINKYKSLEENKIKDSDIITLGKFEDQFD